MPTADDLFRPTTDDTEPEEAPAVAAVPAASATPQPAKNGSRQSSGRVRHDEKMTVYVTADELVDIEHARLDLRRHHGLAVDRGRLVREALAIVLEEGLENRIARHEQTYKRLRAGLEQMGLSYVPKRSLHTLNCIRIPEHADDATVRRRLLEEYGIEIGAGLGPMAGKAWRIGLMGHGSTIRNVDLVLAALKEILRG